MRKEYLAAAVLCFVAGCQNYVATQPQTIARQNLPLEQRLDLPLNHASASLRLTDFVNFIATSYKMPVMAEVVAPLPDVIVPAGVTSARQLLNSAIVTVPGYSWQDEGGVVHIFQAKLLASPGNVLSLPISRFSFPLTVQDFNASLRTCLYGTAHDLGCVGGAISDMTPAELHNEPLPQTQSLRDASARSILLKAMQANGHFYVLVAFPTDNPQIGSDFPFANWFLRSLIPDEPIPIRIQAHEDKHR